MQPNLIVPNGLGKRSKLKIFEMIKLKKEVNKSAIMRELRKEADKMYENSWEREYAIEKFMEGAESLFNLLRLPVVVGQSEQLKAFVDWWHGLSQEELVWYEGRYVEVFLSL
jgi:hypothetical protein